MDFDLVLYIVLVIGSIAVSVVKNMKKDEQERQAKKNRQRPIEVETSQESPTKKKRKTVSPSFTQATETDDGDYFSYETMSDRDFAKEFDEVIEENNDLITKQPASHPQLTINEEEVYKGVVWSEILKRKY